MRDTRATRTARMTLRSLEPGDRAEFVRMHEVSAAFLAPWLAAKTIEEHAPATHEAAW